MRGRRVFVPGLLALAALSCTNVQGPVDRIDPPSFVRVSPTSGNVAITEGQSVSFEVEAQSPGGHTVHYEFRVDGTVAVTAATYVFSPADTGHYQVEAIASDGDQVTTRIWTVFVAEPPNVAPTAVLALDPASGTAPLSVRVRLQGADPDGQVTRYRLVVQGAAAMSLQRAVAIDTVLVLTEGSYTVSGVVEDDHGATATAGGAVQVDPRPNEAPIPRLVVHPSTGTAPLDVVIEGGGLDPDGQIVSYALDVDGDGVFEVESTTWLFQSVRYGTAGSRFVRLRVTDDRGAVARDSVRVVVSPPNDPPPPPPPPPQNAAPTLTLSISPMTGAAPLAVTATVQGSDTDGVIASAAIDFNGDGNAEASASQASLQAGHTYANEGTFTVRAMVSDDKGATASATATVVVTASSNLAPTGTLTAAGTTGDAPFAVTLDAAGSDSDGSIVKWEVDADDGQGFVEIAASGSHSVVYPFRASLYRPRLRLTDDLGAATIVDGPAIEVFRPVSASRSTGSATGNPHFNGLSIAPAIWADGSDRMQFSIVVRDGDGNPMAGVPLRVTSLRPDLIVQGTNLGGTVTISLDGTTTDASGRLTGELTTRTSGRAYMVPLLGVFQSFALKVEADVGHGQWRRLADLGGLNAETVVNGNEQVGQFYVLPQGLTCVGQPLQIHVRAVRRSDAPGAGGPADGLVVEIRYPDSSETIPGLHPAPGYENWRTDANGRIVFQFTPTQSDFRALRALVDGFPLNIPTGLAVQNC